MTAIFGTLLWVAIGAGLYVYLRSRYGYEFANVAAVGAALVAWLADRIPYLVALLAGLVAVAVAVAVLEVAKREPAHHHHACGAFEQYFFDSDCGWDHDICPPCYDACGVRDEIGDRE